MDIYIYNRQSIYRDLDLYFYMDINWRSEFVQKDY